MMPIPDISRLDMAFGNIKHLPKRNTLPDDFQHMIAPSCRAVSSWFYNGGRPTPNGIELDGKKWIAREGVNPAKALAAIKACLASWDPKHEDKIAGCGWMLNEWFEQKDA